MATMRAVLIKDGKGPVENLYIGEIARPSPGPGQVLVKVSAISFDATQVFRDHYKFYYIDQGFWYQSHGPHAA